MGSSYQRVRWFIGLYQYDPNDNKNYRWLDGSVSGFRNWMPTQPNSIYERCAMLDGSNGFKWRDDVCTNRALFICRKDLEDGKNLKIYFYLFRFHIRNVLIVLRKKKKKRRKY